MPDDARTTEACKIIDVSNYEPPRIPSKTWRELIKKVWEVDPLLCPNCGEEMKVISLIQDPEVIRHILEHLGLWKQKQKRAQALPELGPVVYEDFDDGWPSGSEPDLVFY